MPCRGLCLPCRYCAYPFHYQPYLGWTPALLAQAFFWPACVLEGRSAYPTVPFTVGLQIKYLEFTNAGKAAPNKWIRYLTKSQSYVGRWT